MCIAHVYNADASVGGPAGVFQGPMGGTVLATAYVTLLPPADGVPSLQGEVPSPEARVPAALSLT